MASLSETPHTAINFLQGCVVATIQIELEEREVEQLQQDILTRIQHTRARGLILDVSALPLIDSVEFRSLQQIIAMAELMGTHSALVGLRPGIVAALVESDLGFGLVHAVQTLEDAFLLLDRHFGTAHTSSKSRQR